MFNLYAEHIKRNARLDDLQAEIKIGRRNINYPKAFDSIDHDKLWKALREMGIPDHLTCLLRNLYAGQEATVRTLYGTTDWFRIEKGV